MKEVITVIMRSIVSLTVLFAVTKLLGKKQVSQLSVFDYVIGISIGNFAAEITINMETQFINGIVAMIVFGLIAFSVSIITMKSITLRRFFMGTPTILIQKGKILEKNLKKVKFDVNDLLLHQNNNGMTVSIENNKLYIEGTATGIYDFRPVASLYNKV